MSLRTVFLVALTACGDKDPSGSVDVVVRDSGGEGEDDPDTDGDPDSGSDSDPDSGSDSDPDTGGDADADGFTVADGDCDDADPAVHPAAAEVDWDGVDNDCDGTRGHAAVHLALGRHHSCALDAAGVAHCWGSDLDGQASPTSGTFEQLVANDTSTCGRDAAGQVNCWGRPFDGPYVDLNTWMGWVTGGSDAVTTMFWLGSDLCGTNVDDAAWCVGPVSAATGGLVAGAAPVVDGHASAGEWALITRDGEFAGSLVSGPWVLSCESQAGARAPGAWSRWTGLAAVDGGNEHQCTLGTDGTLDCWGCVGGQVVAPPSGRFDAAASGDEHGCALDAAGAATCWGDDSHGQASPPSGVAFGAVEAGARHTCGIRTDGEVECWGDDSAGQSTVP